MGRFDKVITDFFAAKDSISTIRGIGAAPESIEQVPVLYDELYELPWLSVKPDGEAWMKSYVERRYSVQNKAATEAWQILRTTALNCPTALQGPHEAVTCARPSAHVDRVSTWGGTKLFYDAEVTVKAAKLLLNADLSGENYLYDLTDVTRQALTDYANTVLSDSITMREKPEYFLQIIYDIDRLLGTNRNFMLGKWTNMARKIADEVPGTTEKDRDWLELNNALMLITTWGERVNSEDSGLHDYSYRQWNGMLRDFYAERWRKYFAGETVDWFDFERVWTIDGSKKYTDITQGDTKEVAKELLNRYFGGN
jgi:alpha-N-acetylglucosaminidase